MIRRILFAEDNPKDRIPVTAYLRNNHNCEVIEVLNPDQACVALGESQTRNTPFDVIILDLIMPPNNPKGGEQVLLFMKAQGIKTPVVLATAYGYNGPAEEAVKANEEVVKRILTKTFSIQELWDALTEAYKSEQRPP